MRGPSLQKTAIISLALHMTAFLIGFLVLRQTNHVIIPPPYTVSLVSPDMQTNAGTKAIAEKSKEAEKIALPPEPAETARRDTAAEKALIEKKISAIAAKKKIEKIARLRSVISLKAAGTKSPSHSGTQPAPQGKSTMFDDYYAKITREIWQQWVYPDTGKKTIEAIVAVRILKDGTALVQNIEKSSGNALFDRSALKALAKASPLSPPPYEMEIGVRFSP